MYIEKLKVDVEIFLEIQNISSLARHLLQVFILKTFHLIFNLNVHNLQTVFASGFVPIELCQFGSPGMEIEKLLCNVEGATKCFVRTTSGPWKFSP